MSMIKCPGCGREIDDNEDFCYHCGYVFSDMGQSENESEESGKEAEEEILEDETTEWYDPKTQKPTDAFIYDDSFVDYCFDRYYQFSENEIGDISVTFPPINMIDPDTVNSIERSKVMDVLEDVRKITVIKENAIANLLQKDDELDEIRDEALSRLHECPGWVWALKFVIMVVACVPVFLWPSVGTVILAAVVIFLDFKFLGNLIITFAYANQNMLSAEAYLCDALPQNAKEQEIGRRRLLAINSSKECLWGKEIVGEEMLHTEAVDMLIGYIKARRADNIKEALNKYDTDCHEQRMEYMQQEIDNAAQIQALEAQKQTQYAKATAIASSITAYNSWRTRKTTKKIYKKLR